MKDKLESMEKIDNYLNNIIEKKYENKNKNTRMVGLFNETAQAFLKNCPISENIIKIENELYKLR